MINFDRFESSGMDRLLTHQDRNLMFSGKDFKIIKYRGHWYNTDGRHLREELDEEIEIIERKNELSVLKKGNDFYLIYEDNTLTEKQEGCLHFCSNDGIEHTCLNGQWCKNTKRNQERQKKVQPEQQKKEINNKIFKLIIKKD